MLKILAVLNLHIKSSHGQIWEKIHFHIFGQIV